MRELIIVGIGELGKLLGAGALRAGVRVTPVTRAQRLEDVLAQVGPDAPVLVSVAEDALDPLLAALKTARRRQIALLQNELFPSRYRAHGLAPSVLVPWILQKRGLPTMVARPSPLFGPLADLFAEIFGALSLPHVRAHDEGELAQALVDKYTFILTINALGVSADRTLGTWLQEDPALVWDVCEDATRLGQALVEAPIDPARARLACDEGMHALAQIPARGRTARERLLRALAHARRLELSLPALARIAQAS
jgi:ketopantoate reductase